MTEIKQIFQARELLAINPNIFLLCLIVIFTLITLIELNIIFYSLLVFFAVELYFWLRFIVVVALVIAVGLYASQSWLTKAIYKFISQWINPSILEAKEEAKIGASLTML